MLRNTFKNGGAIVFVSVFASLAMYGLSFSLPMAINIRVVLVCAVILLLAVRQISIIIELFQNKFEGGIDHIWLWVRFGLFIVAGIVGLLFLGNIFVDHSIGKGAREFLMKFLGDIPLALPRQDMPNVETLALGDYRELGRFNEYCKGLLSFAAYYSGILSIVLCTYYIYRNGVENREKAQPLEDSLYELFLICVGTIPCLLFFMDFINYGSRAWTKSRFLEIPLFLIIFIFLYFTQRYCTVVQRRWINALLILYMIIPFLATGRHLQIATNFSLFRALVGM